jgi:hypothetical protein
VSIQSKIKRAYSLQHSQYLKNPWVGNEIKKVKGLNTENLQRIKNACFQRVQSVKESARVSRKREGTMTNPTKTKSILGYKLTLEIGKRYLATRPMLHFGITQKRQQNFP